MSHFLANRARLSVLEFPSLFSSGYALFHFPYPASPLLAALTKTTGVCTNSFHSGTPHLLVATCQSPQHLRPLFSYSSALFCTLLHFFALLEDLTLLFSNGSALFAKNTRVGVGLPRLPRASKGSVSAKGTIQHAPARNFRAFCPLPLQSSGMRKAGPQVRTLRRNS